MPVTSPSVPRGRLYLIDGSGYIFRAYHALPPLTRKRDGLPTGAVYGFSNMLNKLLEELFYSILKGAVLIECKFMCAALQCHLGDPRSSD